MPADEPPSLRHSARPFLIGRNHAGLWVVQDVRGMWGGVFVDRTAALKFAMSENGRPRAAIVVPHPFELDLAAASAPSATGRTAPASVLHDRAA
jgi:hypothetical protein